MTEASKKTAYDMLYLTACAVNEIKPDRDRIVNMDLAELYRMCQFHSLTAAVCTALENAGISDKKFQEAKSKAIRKNILLDAERKKIFEFMEENGIWYMPLKGIILKDLYPGIGMRQMADNDILYDRNFQKQLKAFMVQNGYKAESVGKTHHDEYLKEPVYNFEMHTNIYDEAYKNFADYYSGIKSRLLKDKDNGFGYHLADEDFYIYITAHEYKHYMLGGTGLRSLVDCYVYIHNKGDKLDWDYIKNELSLLEINEFEQESREICLKIFSPSGYSDLSEHEREMLEYYLFSGTYGTMQNLVNNKMEKFREETGSMSKFRYVWSRIFPPLECYRLYYPFFYRHKLLLPIGWTYRAFRGLLFRRKRFKAEMNIVKQTETLK